MSLSANSGITTSNDNINEGKSESFIKKEDNSQKENSFSWIEKPFGLEQHVLNRIGLVLVHSCTLYYCFIYHITKQVNPKSILFELFYSYLSGLGTTVGCHRYWTHKTFKANLPLQIILMMLHTMTFQYPIYKWCQDHRLHHKYTDTDADPHNSKRGFWFSHIGWLVLPKTKELKEKLKTFDMPDLENDPIIRFQSRWYFTLVAVLRFFIPISVYYYVFDMSLLYSFLANGRSLAFNLHVTFCVNSVAHLWGDKPYDKTISSVENKFVTLITGGEGWHNYHHTFPWDYRASEFGWKLNFSTALIDFFAWIGWAWDMKTVSETMVHEKIKKTGDGSRIAFEGSTKLNGGICETVNTFEDLNSRSLIWGWDDESITDNLRQMTRIINPKRKAA